MNARRWILVVVAAGVLAVSVAGGLRLQERSRVRKALVAYNEALSKSLLQLDPEQLDRVASEREKTRVSTYITLLWGEGVRMESTLLDLEIESLESEGATTTAVARESWRYLKRDRKSGQAVGEPSSTEQRLRYTLTKSQGGLRVHLSEALPEGEQQ